MKFTYAEVSEMHEDDVICEAIGIIESRLRRAPRSVVANPQDAKALVRLKLSELEHEVFAVLFLDQKHALIEYDEMFRGTINGASVYPREVAKAALKHNAAAVLFAHNHPSGDPTPSDADKRITDRLVSVLKVLDVTVVDHLIVGSTKTYSFAETGLL